MNSEARVSTVITEIQRYNESHRDRSCSVLSSMTPHISDLRDSHEYTRKQVRGGLVDFNKAQSNRRFGKN